MTKVLLGSCAVLCASFLLTGCAQATYAYSFDLQEPGAHNIAKAGERDLIEDGDVKSELLVDPTSFQAVLLEITNKTEALIGVDWGRISIIGPDGVETPLRPDVPLGTIEPGAKVIARLITFALPERGPGAAAYDQATFELVVPMNVRGVSREYRYHLIARLHKL